MAPDKTFSIPKLSFPNSVVSSWMSDLRIDECEISYTQRTDNLPASVSVFHGDQNLFVAWSELLRDGLHFYVSNRGMSFSSGDVCHHIILRNKSNRECKMAITSSCLSMIALCHKIKFGDGQGKLLSNDLKNKWMKGVYSQINNSAKKKGIQTFEGVTDGFFKIIESCSKLFESALNRHIDESMSRVKKEFLFLSDCVDEDKILEIWRNTIVEKVQSQ